MVAAAPFETMKRSSDDDLILNVLDRARIESPSSTDEDREREVQRLDAFIHKGIEHVLAMEQVWKNLSAVALTYGAESLHQSRNVFQQLLNARKDLLEKIEGAVTDARIRFGRTPSAVEHLPKCRALLERFQTAILDKWIELEDLEEILLKPFQVPHARLIELATHNSPPQSWYAETFDPFAPEPLP